MDKLDLSTSCATLGRHDPDKAGRLLLEPAQGFGSTFPERQLSDDHQMLVG
jgi:hypothetical protein